MSDSVLDQLLAIIQRDVNHRGLATDPKENLLTVCRDDFAQACQSLATTKKPVVAIVTGFWIPAAEAAETDGPLGAVFLARVLDKLGAKVILATDDFCHPALRLALQALKLTNRIQAWELAAKLRLLAITFPPSEPPQQFLDMSLQNKVADRPFTHLIAIERPGPSHTPGSLALQIRQGPVPAERFRVEVPADQHGQCHTMRGRIITDKMFPTHRWFEEAMAKPADNWLDQILHITTIGIGDGGNEIGMGKIPWEIIARNVPGGGLVACRVPADYNIVCGVSNWGAYALAAGVWHLRGKPYDPELFSPDRERQVWEEVLQQAVLVDGVTGARTLTVDGLAWEDYIQPLREIGAVLDAAKDGTP